MSLPRPRHLAILAVLAVAAAASALGGFGDTTPHPAAAMGSAVPARDAVPAPARPRESRPLESEPPAPQTREAALAALDTTLIQQRQPAAPVTHDAFARHSWAVPPPPAPPEPPPPPAAPPPPPQAPLLPFKYLGMLEDAPSPTVWYLAVGERLIVTVSGETIDGVWRVDGLHDGRLVFTYVPLEQRLSMPIGGPP